ncbi:MAG: LysR family transcriptional regulator [Alphaproteobacteria bacterium]|nr:LysR family transcriptional regulator [Alphaproteobacteria bacterium]
MSLPDLNLLVALDVLLAEGSVARAARRLRLSPSATSRALARLRAATGDPLLVRAGRGLVPTPRAQALRARVGPLVEDAAAILRPAEALDLRTLARSFTLRSSDGFVETFGPALIARVARDAPAVRLRFVPNPDKDSGPLRDGTVDLETGVVVPTTGPEVRTQALFRDRFVGVVRPGHALSRGAVTPARYAAERHVLVARRTADREGIDDALAPLGLHRDIAAVVGGFAAALALARSADLVASVPERHTAMLRAGLHSFALPVALPEITVSLCWHPRQDADPAHRWLRGCVRDACREAPAGAPTLRRPTKGRSAKARTAGG